eukprot:g9130.t1
MGDDAAIYLCVVLQRVIERLVAGALNSCTKPELRAKYGGTRSVVEPGADVQPRHLQDYIRTNKDMWSLFNSAFAFQVILSVFLDHATEMFFQRLGLPIHSKGALASCEYYATVIDGLQQQKKLCRFPSRNNNNASPPAEHPLVTTPAQLSRVAARVNPLCSVSPKASLMVEALTHEIFMALCEGVLKRRPDTRVITIVDLERGLRDVFPEGLAQEVALAGKEAMLNLSGEPPTTQAADGDPAGDQVRLCVRRLQGTRTLLRKNFRVSPGSLLFTVFTRACERLRIKESGVIFVHDGVILSGRWKAGTLLTAGNRVVQVFAVCKRAWACKQRAAARRGLSDGEGVGGVSKPPPRPRQSRRWIATPAEGRKLDLGRLENTRDPVPLRQRTGTFETGLLSESASTGALSVSIGLRGAGGAGGVVSPRIERTVRRLSAMEVCLRNMEDSMKELRAGDLDGRQSGVFSVAMAAITSQLEVAFNLSSLCRQVLSSADEGARQISQASQPAKQPLSQDRVATHAQSCGEVALAQQSDSFLTEVPTEPPNGRARNTAVPPLAGKEGVDAPCDVSSSREPAEDDARVREPDGAPTRQAPRTPGGALTSPPDRTTNSSREEVPPRRHQPAEVPMQQQTPSGSRLASGGDAGYDSCKRNNLHVGDTQNGGVGGGQLVGSNPAASSLSRGQIEEQHSPAEGQAPIVEKEEIAASSWSSMASLGQDSNGGETLEEEAVVPPEETPSSWSLLISEQHHGHVGGHPSCIPEESSAWSGYINEFQSAPPPETTTPIRLSAGSDVGAYPTGEGAHTQPTEAAVEMFRGKEIAHNKSSEALAREPVSEEHGGRTALRPTTPPKNGDRVQPQSYGMDGGRAEKGGAGLPGDEVRVASRNANEGLRGDGSRNGGLALDLEYEGGSAVLGTTRLSSDGGTGSGDTDGRLRSPIAGVAEGGGGQAESPRDLPDAIPLEVRPPSNVLAPIVEPDAEAEDPYSEGEWDDEGDDEGDDGNWSSWLTGAGRVADTVPSSSDT